MIVGGIAVGSERCTVEFLACSWPGLEFGLDHFSQRVFSFAMSDSMLVSQQSEKGCNRQGSQG